MLPIEILAYIVKLSDYQIALKVMSVFNIKNYELFIDMLVERFSYRDSVRFKVGGNYHYRYGPAIEHRNGTKIWYMRNKVHRSDGPAIICFDGAEMWCQNGMLHREDGPAIIYPNGCAIWYQNGEINRRNISGKIEFFAYENATY